MEAGRALTEPGVRAFVRRALLADRRSRNETSSLVFNAGLFIGFVVVVGGVLCWRYTGRPGPHVRAAEERRKREYIISKLQTLSALKRRADDGMITNLPVLETQ
jgi:hypothetical protein